MQVIYATSSIILKKKHKKREIITYQLEWILNYTICV